MIITDRATPFDNQVICGERLIPADRYSAHATYLRHGRVCGITYEIGPAGPYLRCNPGYQLPPYARARRPFKRFLWECEDDRAIDVTLDTRDGELVFICHDDHLDENSEATIESCLEFLLGDTFHDELVEYVRKLAN